MLEHLNHCKRRQSPFLIVPFLLILLGGAASAQPQQAAHLEDIVNIDLRTDVRLFTVMAALNAAGYDYELPGQEMSRVRTEVRNHLRNLDPALVSRLHDFYRTHRGSDAVETQAAFTSFALLLSGPPQFELALDLKHMPPGTEGLAGFELLLSEFYRAAQIDSLWSRLQQAHGEELIAYRPVLMRVIRDTLEYLRMPPRVVLDRRIVLMSDLLSHHDVVNARNLQTVYYMIVGPTHDPAANYLQLQHEYLHFILDPIVDKFGPEIFTDEKILEIVHDQPELSDQYRQQMSVVTTESLIEALQLRLHTPPDLDEALVARFRKGLVLTPYFYELLKSFEEEDGEERFAAFLEKALEDLSSKRVEKDAEEITRIEAELAERRTAELNQELERRRQAEIEALITRLLNEAGRLAADKRVSQAREKLNELKQLDPDNARADFYLAQLANQEGDYETAFRYYQKASQSPESEPWVKAWATLRIGRYLASQGKFAEARAHFEEVLRLEGDLQGAHDMARESLAQLPD